MTNIDFGDTQLVVTDIDIFFGILLLVGLVVITIYGIIKLASYIKEKRYNKEKYKKEQEFLKSYKENHPYDSEVKLSETEEAVAIGVRMHRDPDFFYEMNNKCIANTEQSIRELTARMDKLDPSNPKDMIEYQDLYNRRKTYESNLNYYKNRTFEYRGSDYYG